MTTRKPRVRIPANAYIQDGLLIVGSEAWTLEEWERRPRTNEQHRIANREYMWNRRRHPVGSLHDLACTGPTRATGCVCRKIVCYDKPAEAAA